MCKLLKMIFACIINILCAQQTKTIINTMSPALATHTQEHVHTYTHACLSFVRSSSSLSFYLSIYAGQALVRQCCGGVCIRRSCQRVSFGIKTQIEPSDSSAQRGMVCILLLRIVNERIIEA